MPYYFECDACGTQHGYEPEAGGPLHRTCHECGTDGCVDCIPHEMCLARIREDAEDCDCVACLNGWSHGV